MFPWYKCTNTLGGELAFHWQGLCAVITLNSIKNVKIRS
jgi:hypothetical protein